MRPLTSSSLIELIAPGSPVTAQQVRFAVEQVKGLGFEARPRDQWLHNSFLVSSKAGSFSESASIKKFQHLKQALTAFDSSAIWCVRGGYGSQKLMPFLMKMKKPVKPKIFIGYSDATVIQVFLNLKWKWPVLHFPVLIHLKESSVSALKRFQNLLIGAQKQQNFSGLKILSKKKMKNNSINSLLTGGNLTLIQSSVGTPWAGSFQNKILFLEDTGEAPYRLDRALWQMLNAGVFKGVKAVVLGDFIYSGLKNSQMKTRKVFQSFADAVPFPVVEGVPCGHGPRKEALPFLTPCSLKILSGGKAQLCIASPFMK